jgi:Nucleotidyl transferase AbiEii toxin, Type IV TA system
MNPIALLPASDRAALFTQTAARMGSTPAVAEKDFWVTWVLFRVFSDAQLRQQLMFKGGTSLSKAYGLIERFSEDIDLVLDWQLLGATANGASSSDSPAAPLSNTAQAKHAAALHTKAQAFIANDLLPRMAQLLAPVCQVTLEANDANVINVAYPASFANAYLRPEVRLEIGALAAWSPHEWRSVRSYAAGQLPQVFERLGAPVAVDVPVISAQRTFWEKATILHAEAQRTGEPPLRYSRHYYDLACMAQSPMCNSAVMDVALLAQVVAFKTQFYPRAWARYDLAVPRTLQLLPTGAVLLAMRKDYQAMQDMIFGAVPSFDEILATLDALQTRINQNHP